MWWALTVGGAGGVAGLMEYFDRELVNTMLHCGVDKVSALGSAHVQRAIAPQSKQAPSARLRADQPRADA